MPSSPTAPIIAGDQVFIAANDSHMLYALSRATGDVIWRFTADARIDSPPTYTRGLVLFGSRGGWVYAIRARDGALAWRFMDSAGATADQRSRPVGIGLAGMREHSGA